MPPVTGRTEASPTTLPPTAMQETAASVPKNVVQTTETANASRPQNPEATHPAWHPGHESHPSHQLYAELFREFGLDAAIALAIGTAVTNKPKLRAAQLRENLVAAAVFACEKVGLASVRSFSLMYRRHHDHTANLELAYPAGGSELERMIDATDSRLMLVCRGLDASGLQSKVQLALPLWQSLNPPKRHEEGSVVSRTTHLRV